MVACVWVCNHLGLAPVSLGGDGFTVAGGHGDGRGAVVALPRRGEGLAPPAGGRPASYPATPIEIQAPAPAVTSPLHRHAGRAVICTLRMAGGQCPLKRGAIDHHRCHGELVNQIDRRMTN